MSHPRWELVHHKNNDCHFESGRCTSQKKHITDFEVLQATEGMCVLCSHYAFSSACLFVCLLKANTLLNSKGGLPNPLFPFYLANFLIQKRYLVFTSVKISCVSNILSYQKGPVREEQRRRP